MEQSSINSSNCIPNEDIPVLLTIFNRPNLTRKVIESLRHIKPKRLFIAADGPRSDRPQDIERCQLARQEAITVDWSCEIKTRFLDENLSVDPAVSSAIDWFFQQVEFGVILEDDCIVHPDFFTLCGELFIRYADDKRIMQVSSLSPCETLEYPYDYHFSRTFRCSGGWGTWRRAWRHYTSDMSQYGDNESLNILKAYHLDYYKCLWQHKKLLEIKSGDMFYPYWSHWDYQWNLACSAQNGLCIVPVKNLMNNIGFAEDSTHTVSVTPVFENLRVQPLCFPLRHPLFVYADHHPERRLEKRIFRSLPLKSRCVYLLRRIVGAYYYLREIMPYCKSDSSLNMMLYTCMKRGQ